MILNFKLKTCQIVFNFGNSLGKLNKYKNRWLEFGVIVDLIISTSSYDRTTIFVDRETSGK